MRKVLAWIFDVLGEGVVTFMKGCERFHAKFLIPLTAKYCKVTGKDNFHFAKATLFTGIFLMIIRDPSEGWFIPWMVLMYAFIGWACWMRIREVEKIVDVDWQKGEMTFDIRLLTNLRACMSTASIYSFFGYISLILTIIPALFGAGDLWIFIHSLGFIFMGWSQYIVWYFTPPGKSLYSRAKDKLKSWAPRWEGGLVPQPVPVRV